MDKVKIVDGTLREGEQTPGVHFTKEEKLQIARELDRIGVPLLDVGMPSISDKEREAIAAIVQQGLQASIGVSVRMRREEVDQAAHCGAEEIFLVCPVSRLHLSSKLGMDEDGLKRLASDVTGYAAGKGLVVNLVAEDASRAEISFLCDILCLSYDWGARRAFICDTVGVMEPFGMKELVTRVRGRVPREMELGVHCHNDFGLATANTVAAIEAGVDFPSVTVNGIGERAGNAPLHEVAMAIEKIIKRWHGIDVRRLYDLARLVERSSGIFISPHTPIVGLNAFRHESGVHVDGILKNSQTYTGLDPQEVSRTSSFVLGKHTGTRTIRHLLQQRGYQADEAELGEILHRVKERKASEGKEEIDRMAGEIGKFYERCLSFPQEVFWEIVEEVMGKSG